MFQIPTLHEFYTETLKRNGFEPSADQLEKVAAANKIDVETAKVASAIFEQFQLDGVQFESPKDMLDNALKMASAYFDTVKSQQEEAEKLAGQLHKVALHAIEGFLTHNRIELDANEAVKVAGLQAESFQKLTQHEAELRRLTDKLASTKLSASYGNLGANIPQVAENLHVDSAIAEIAQGYNADPSAVKEYLSAHVPDQHMKQHLHGMLQAAGQGHGRGSLPELHEHVMKNGPNAAAAAKPGLLGRPGLLLAGGALGLGALALMKKKREEAAKANAGAGLANVANMPSA